MLLHLLGVATPEDLIGRFATVRAPPTFVPPPVAPRWNPKPNPNPNQNQNLNFNPNPNQVMLEKLRRMHGHAA